jgi:hypothetical protein
MWEDNLLKNPLLWPKIDIFNKHATVNFVKLEESRMLTFQ